MDFFYSFENQDISGGVTLGITTPGEASGITLASNILTFSKAGIYQVTLNIHFRVPPASSNLTYDFHIHAVRGASNIIGAALKERNAIAAISQPSLSASKTFLVRITDVLADTLKFVSDPSTTNTELTFQSPDASSVSVTIVKV